MNFQIRPFTIVHKISVKDVFFIMKLEIIFKNLGNDILKLFKNKIEYDFFILWI
jgi:hypothetical protein